MSLEARITELAQAIGADIKALEAGGGSGVQQVFVQQTAPVVAPGTSYIWYQTGLGPSGLDVTIWVEDGL